MAQNTFTIIFKKLAEVLPDGSPSDSETLRAEIDEIAELRRLVLEITDPEPTSYTAT